MDAELHRKSVAQLERQVRFLRLIAVMLGSIVLAQSAAVLALGNASERIVIVPPEVNNEFWVEEDRVSRRYFLEWGHYLATLLLNVTPESADYQAQVLLRHVAHQSHAAFENRLSIAGKRLRKERLSTFFSAVDVHVDLPGRSIAFVGTLTSYVEGRRVAEREAAYKAIFLVKNGALRLLEFVETKPNEPFLLRNQQ